jgi:hypothetical protein
MQQFDFESEEKERNYEQSKGLIIYHFEQIINSQFT